MEEVANVRISSTEHTISPADEAGLVSFRLYVSVFLYRIETGAITVVTEISVAYDQGLRVAAVQVLEQRAERCLLRLCTRVIGLTSNIQPALVADAYRVGVVVQAVGTDEILRAARFDRSVTTDDVVIANAEVETPLAVPGVDLGGR